MPHDQANRIDARRRFLMQALSSGALIGGAGWNQAALAGWFGSRPRKLPEGRSIHEMRGQVLINGKTARKDQLIQGNDRVEVGPGGQIIFGVGANAFIVRERSILEMNGKDLFVNAMQLVSGAVLGVFGKRKTELPIRTSTATIGIRGTAVYTEAHPDRSYACTCYGQTVLQTTHSAEREDISTTHHDSPRWILGANATGPAIVAAPMINHDDMELMLLEALCGREVPFATPVDLVGGPSRGY